MNITQINFIDKAHQDEIDNLYFRNQMRHEFDSQKEVCEKILKKLESYIFGEDWNWTSQYNASWITINTNISKSIEIPNALKILDKKLKSLYSRKKELNNCILLYCHEFYTKSNNHLHIHLLLFKQKSEHRFGKEKMIEYFFDKKIIPNRTGIHVEYPKKSKTKSHMGISEKRCHQVIKYILGKKQGKKKDNVKKDIEFRRNWNLKECYLRGNEENNPALFRFLHHEMDKYIHENEKSNT
jgi:hypothetical protein